MYCKKKAEVTQRNKFQKGNLMLSFMYYTTTVWSYDLLLLLAIVNYVLNELLTCLNRSLNKDELHKLL